MSCSAISDLPTDVLLYNILSHLDAPSLARLSETSRLFSQLCQDELLWKHLVMEDYHIPLDASFRQLGWKNLYSRLNDSKVYTWGENSDSRLGHSTATGERLFVNSFAVSTPQELTTLRGKNIIDIVAGGWSFHALDKHGRVWMWGTMQQEANRSRSLGRRLVSEPTLVEFPPNTHIVSISAGRSHAIALDQDGNVWHWSNIWRPQRVCLPSALENQTVVQVTANWGNSSVLTESGHLVVVPLPRMVPPSEPGDLPDLLLDSESTVVFGLDNLHRDDTLHRAHDQSLNSDEGYLARPVLEEDHIVQIAGMEHHTLALSRFGRIYRIDVNRATPSLATTSYVIEYLHFGASPTQQEDNQRSHLHRFISASFHSFAVYTLDGQVMLGKHDDPYDQQPKVISNQGFCKVSFGDYHFGALTNQGDLLTWGAFSAGALGHGNSHEDHVLEEPHKVAAFENMYVFAIGFGGWHSGVLAIPKDF